MINMNKKLKLKLSIFCILSHYLISMILNHSLLSYYPHGVGAEVTENRAGRKLLLKKAVLWIRIRMDLYHLAGFGSG